jgi:PIN domain nuclease of toxin-antitoxin system
MRLLLDTHVFIWALDDDPRLSNTAWSMIEDAVEVYVSSASLWEATINLNPAVTPTQQAPFEAPG